MNKQLIIKEYFKLIMSGNYKKVNQIKKEYPQTKIILPPHLRENHKKTKIISNNI